ncbi:response regulator [Spirulina sp. CS-785/01]|uniref:response regulator n=1 Tax=Spirulina sp. CS-785/01 TaxID=3021716 RepID=UPI00232B4384|nr:response regulator [Spirulina sp. CS-785/01]MDB9313737.1 response regulator [Spirulina sp. CS-785/01]
MTPVNPSPLNSSGRSKIAPQQPDSSPAHDSQASPDLKEQLLSYSHNKFTGKLSLQLVTGEQWELYFSLGRLVWATGGFHPVRRWLRQLWRCCPDISPSQLNLRRSDRWECWDYQVLAVLIQRQLSPTKAVVAAMLGMITEVLFDISQTWELTSRKKKLQRNPKSRHTHKPLYRLTPYPGVRPSHSSILPQSSTWSLEAAFLQIELVWEQWSQATLYKYSPNFAPVITDPSQLQEYAPEATYQNLRKLLNGQRTLRDVAILCEQDLLTVSCSLLPYIHRHLIQLTRIPDLPCPEFQGKPAVMLRKEGLWEWTEPTEPTLIATLVEDEEHRQTLDEISDWFHYRTVAIASNKSPLPVLLQQQPNLIVLENSQSVTNSYDLCSKIRASASFQQTPIIILTDKSNMIDRVRAKFAGVTDFLVKPITPEKVKALFDQYLSDTASDASPD